MKINPTGLLAVVAFGGLLITAAFAKRNDEGLAQLRRLAASTSRSIKETRNLGVIGDLPGVVAESDFHPAQPEFGFDPALASEVYGRQLRFTNLDPAAFPPTDLGNAAREGLAHLLTHGTNDNSFPLWTRLASASGYGDLKQQLLELGHLPSPFRYHLRGKTLVRLVDAIPYNSKLGQEYEIEVPYSISLGESVYRRETETGNNSRMNDYLVQNCFQCHAGLYSNHVVGGAPNKNLNPEWISRRSESKSLTDFVSLWESSPTAAKRRLQANDLLGKFGIRLTKPLYLMIDEHDGDHLFNVYQYSINVDRKILSSATNETVGVTPGNLFVLGKLAHLKKNAETLDDWQLPKEAWQDGSPYSEFLQKHRVDGDTEFAVVASRAWWLARYSGHHFWTDVTPGGVRASAADLALALATPFHGNHHAPPMAQRYEISERLQSYIYCLESPDYPKRIDYTAASRGMSVYSSRCADCHGRIEIDHAPNHPADSLNVSTRYVLAYDRSQSRIPYSEVGTDDLYWKHSSLHRGVVDNLLLIPESEKYVITGGFPRPDEEPVIDAPPLVGLWASAPYLHNESVPTVALVLNSQARPECWRMDEDPYAYDFKNLGVAFRAVEPPAEKREPLDWLVYDTRRRENGMTNVGHPYGDSLTEQERQDVIEFLKVLDSRHVRPVIIDEASEQP